MNNIKNVVDYSLIAVGSVISFANIETILGIVLLIIQISWLLTKLIYKIVITIKQKGNLDELDKEVTDITEVIETIIEEKENIEQVQIGDEDGNIDTKK